MGVLWRATGGPRLRDLTLGLVPACVVALSLASPAWAASRASAAPALHVIPFPGTPDASLYSHIIFSSLAPSEITSVTVTGSRSGSHTGHLTALPDGAGTAFLSSRAFTPGEQVQVTARLSSPAAGTASGDPGATVLEFAFTVAVPAHSTTAPASPPAEDWPTTPAISAPPTRAFRSGPGLDPPQVSVTSDPDTRSGDIFLTPTNAPQSGPMILNSRGRLVWFLPIDGFATNLEVQRYEGRPVLTWFQQTGGRRATNEDVIMNRSYKPVGTVHAAEGYLPDMHEFQITPRGTALIDAYTQVQADLTNLGGPANGIVMDCLIQEVDIRTGQLLWEWHALGHVPVSASYRGTPQAATPYDFFHLNSIQELPNGNLVISARHTWSVYEIDKRTGGVIWTLGGKYSSFKVRPGAGFEWQHDAHLSPHGILSVFDDAANGRSQEESGSSAKTIRLNRARMTASPVRSYTHRPPLISDGEGSTQLLGDHDVFVGWGSQPDFSEFTSGGRQIFNGSFPAGITSYRAYRFPWNGQPATRPSVAISTLPADRIKVYVSWNGATDVAAWRVQAGDRPDALHPVDRSRRTGFETVLTLHRPGPYLALQALNAQGRVLATSTTHRT